MAAASPSFSGDLARKQELSGFQPSRSGQRFHRPVESREGDKAGARSPLLIPLASPLLLMASMAVQGEGYLRQADTGAQTSASIDAINLHFCESFSHTWKALKTNQRAWHMEHLPSKHASVKKNCDCQKYHIPVESP